MIQILSLEFGLKEFGVVNSKERLKRYHRYVFETGAIDKSEKSSAGVIDKSVLEKERENASTPLLRRPWAMATSMLS
jgi:hypothetical protein